MDILERIFECGVVGCGGAGFPSHVKWQASPEIFILNGAECEPLLRTDRWLMEYEAAAVVEAAGAVSYRIGAQKTILALKENYVRERSALMQAIEQAGSSIELFLLKNFYPAGDEQVLIQEVTGRTVPPAGLPSSVGTVVSNVGTMYAVSEALAGRPFTWKHLTIAGAVKNPAVIKAPIGASIADCIALAGPKTEDYDFIIGGPLMGKFFHRQEAASQVVTKVTSGVIVLAKESGFARRQALSAEQMMKQAKSACIQCSHCTELCPRHLLGHPIRPNRIMGKLAYARDMDAVFEEPDIRQALLCSECGVCEVYACPMGLNPRRVNQFIKGQLAARGVKYERNGESCSAREEWTVRRIPSGRLAARLELRAFYDWKAETCAVLQAGRVEIPVKQHAGAPSLPMVKEGDSIKSGQLIAGCAKGTLGANIHASIDGVVTAVGTRIVIER